MKKIKSLTKDLSEAIYLIMLTMIFAYYIYLVAYLMA